MKKIVGIALAIIMCAGTAFAVESKTVEKTESKSNAPKMYAKVNMGYGGGMPLGLLGYSNYFNIEPVFGIYPVSGNKKFAVECSVDMNFGKVYSYSSSTVDGVTTETVDGRSTHVIVPKVQALYYFTPDELFSIYLGAGLGLAIGPNEYTEEGTEYRFNVNCLIGGCWNVNKKVAINAACDLDLVGFWSWKVKAGALYRFN